VTGVLPVYLIGVGKSPLPRWSPIGISAKLKFRDPSGSGAFKIKCALIHALCIALNLCYFVSKGISRLVSSQFKFPQPDSILVTNSILCQNVYHYVLRKPQDMTVRNFILSTRVTSQLPSFLLAAKSSYGVCDKRIVVSELRPAVWRQVNHMLGMMRRNDTSDTIASLNPLFLDIAFQNLLLFCY
jgi:hypothetical protein